MELIRMREQEDIIGTEIVNAAFVIHKKLGPGLLESVYEVCLEYELKKKGLKVDRQISVPIEYDGVELGAGLKLDLLINDMVIVELKAVENYNKLWEAQIISYLKLTYLNLGYLINFNVPILKQGIKRIRMDKNIHTE